LGINDSKKAGTGIDLFLLFLPTGGYFNFTTKSMDFRRTLGKVWLAQYCLKKD